MVRFQHIATWPLTVRVPMLVAVLMIGVAGLISQIVLSRLIQDQESNLALLTDAYLDGLTAAVLPGVLRADVWEAFDALDRARARYMGLNVRYAIVEAAGGDVLAASDPVRFPAHSVIPTELRQRFPAKDGLVIDSNAGHAWLARSLQEEGFSVGRILAEINIADLLRVRREVLLTLILANGGLALAFAVVGYAMTRRMVGPIKLLGDYVERVRDGSAEPIPQARLGDERTEFGRLFRRFNAMAKAIDDREALAQRLAGEEKVYLLGKLASGMAHEVNNPLGGMMNAVDTLRKHGANPEARSRSLDLLERGLAGIRNVVRAALVTYKGGDQPDRLSRGDIDDLRYLVQHETIRRRIKLEWTNRLPDSLAVDAAATRQIVLNLLLNACAASPLGGRVCVEAGAEDGVLKVTIVDQGPGLPQDMVDLLGAAPQVAPSAKVGLGLWTASRLLDRVGGLAVAEVVDGGGTTITVVIPIERGERLHAVA